MTEPALTAEEQTAAAARVAAKELHRAATTAWRAKVAARTERGTEMAKIEPALSAEEWEGAALCRVGDTWEPTVPTRHALAALCLDGQSFGFSRDLYTRLRHAPSLQGYGDDHFVISREDLKILLQARTEATDRIEALLPPEED